MAETQVPVSKIRDYFGMTTQEFTKQWREMDEKDKAEIRSGFDNGTMTY